jgi:hypothetical protein
MLRAILILLLPLGAAACAASHEPAQEAGPVPPLARAALAEWEAWGGIVVVGWPEARPPDTAATPERLARLMEYWTAVPGGAGVARRLAALHAAIADASVGQFGAETQDQGDDGLVARAVVAAPGPEDMSIYAFPAWSAAFVSAMARRAGIPAADLPPAERHARYIDAVLARATAAPDGAAFVPHAPEDRAPRPGDLLCADRSAAPLSHWSMRLAEVGRPRPMHCDIVVQTSPGTIEAVGGNVQDLVVLRRLPADASGRVVPAPAGQPPFIVVLAAKDSG